MDKHYKPHEFAQLVGVSVKTLQRWDTLGRLKAHRSPSNRRYYTHQQYLTYLGGNAPSADRYAVIYARVSNRAQKDDLANQVQFLREFANARGWIIDQVIEDIGSGLNYRRKHWNTLLTDALNPASACQNNEIRRIYWGLTGWIPNKSAIDRNFESV